MNDSEKKKCSLLKTLLYHECKPQNNEKKSVFVNN